ncbi:peroxiredoxin-like family protein [Deinococcus peraridilitoris]|uniref:thioredoxin-dependent peroxiredoxin n=1 Tax=Deinococcus peraridilitoris (strain DSM 19664 / LMG 22246 / CIP 109416 / KR-200) TaxID=937777 RepID=L0A3U4_DEIPD|nr:peroxiredoxin-like family protein [Deinococcus peraridilitoris]AFZ67675.1 Peroxiredoxin [Deinococcus peraridilitoris DSM 19664]
MLAESQLANLYFRTGAALGETLMGIKRRGQHGVLDVQLGGQLRTCLAFERGRLSAVDSPLLFPWSVSLQRGRVNARAIERAQTVSSSALEMLRTLERDGHVSRDDLARLARERVLMALLPLVRAQDSRLRFTVAAPHRNLPRPGVLATELLADADERLARLDGLEAALQPHQRCRLTSGATVVPESLQGLPEQHWNVLTLLSEGLTLAEVARRAVLPWDELTLSVRRLERRGFIRVEASSFAPRAGVRLVPGDFAPHFTLPDVSGRPVSLSAYRHGKLLLTFNRQAGCAFCNPRTQRLIEAYPVLRAAGVEVLSVFGSTVEALQAHVGQLQPPFTLLSDPHDTSHAEYGVGYSLLGFLDPRNLPTMLRGVRMPTFGRATDGELLRMPAEFLIGPGLRIERAHYNAYAADFLPIEDILGWGRAGS